MTAPRLQSGPQFSYSVAPRSWPVVEKGLLMAYVGPIVTVRIEDNVTEASLDRFVTEWPRGIDMRGPEVRAAALYDIPSFYGVNALRRQRMAELLKSRAHILRQTTKAWVLVTDSSLVRGMVQAIHWVQTPPYPHGVVRDAREGFAFIKRHMPEIDDDRLSNEYAQLLTAHRARLRR